MYGVEIPRVATTPANMMWAMAESVRVTEGPLGSPQWFDVEPVYKKAAETGSRLLLTGQFGDEMVWDEGYLVDMVRHLSFREVRAHLREYPRWWIGPDPNDFPREFRSELARSLVPGPLAPQLRRLRVLAGRPRPRTDWWASDLRKRLATTQLQRYPRRGEFASWHGRNMYSYCSQFSDHNGRRSI